MSREEETEERQTAWDYTEEESSAREETQNCKDRQVDINKNEVVIHQQKAEDEQEEYTGENDREYGRSGKWEESQVHSESESSSTGNIQ